MADSRNQISDFAGRLADIQMLRHPLAKDVVFVFNNATYDIYRDNASQQETDRANKRIIVETEKDIWYIQEWADEEGFSLDEELNPWVVTFTVSHLPRTPRQDDYIIIDGIKYTISRIKPVNKRITSVVTALVYPERTFVENELEIFDFIITVDDVEVESLYNNPGKEHIVEILFAGNPEYISFDNINWQKFSSKFKITPSSPLTVFIKDEVITVSKLVP